MTETVNTGPLSAAANVKPEQITSGRGILPAARPRTLFSMHCSSMGNLVIDDLSCGLICLMAGSSAGA